MQGRNVAQVYDLYSLIYVAVMTPVLLLLFVNWPCRVRMSLTGVCHGLSCYVGERPCCLVKRLKSLPGNFRIREGRKFFVESYALSGLYNVDVA